jgi:hypothetical protein
MTPHAVKMHSCGPVAMVPDSDHSLTALLDSEGWTGCGSIVTIARSANANATKDVEDLPYECCGTTVWEEL